jgi:cell division protein FtsL
VPPDELGIVAMVKMLICMMGAMTLAVMTLQLRQQRLELNYKISQLHRQIESHQAKLWNQQLQIAVYTAPNAIQHTVSNHDLHLVPRSPLPQGMAGVDWISDPDAE